MLSIGSIGNANAASNYYESDDYYVDGQSPSTWVGAGAKDLGIEGESVDKQQFESLLKGEVEGQKVGTVRDGEWSHRAGIDLTFSAPKSVSLMAEVAGDKSLISAHDAAVREVLGKVESMTETRIRNGGEVERVNTGNALIATFRHDMSREKDPQLHTHSVVLNLTKSEDGKWRSTENREIFKNQKELGLMYRQALAERVTELGYVIEGSTSTKGGDWNFEIKGVSKETISEFSTRSQQVEAALAERGQDRKSATSKEKEMAALDSRQVKDKEVDRSVVRANWRDRAKEIGADLDKVRENAENRSKTMDYSKVAREKNVAAYKGVAEAVQHLTERDAAFSRQSLEREAWRFSDGQSTRDAISKAIEKMEEKGELIGRNVEVRGRMADGYTTREMISLEKSNMQMVRSGQRRVDPIASPNRAADVISKAMEESRSAGHEWTADQRSATAQLLQSKDQIAVVQGAAGTAKTSTVLRTYAKEVQDQGGKIVGMSPTNSAAKQLAKSAGIEESKTVASFLNSIRREDASLGDRRGEIWVVDEASMLSTKDMHSLQSQAIKHEARLVLVGDSKQLSSVGAGNAFEQVQKAAGKQNVIRLDEIVRQKDEQLKKEVEQAYRGQARDAINSLKNRGKVTEIAGREERLSKVAEMYSSKNAEDRSKTLVVSPTNRDRIEINQKIQVNLKVRGELGEGVKANILKTKGLTDTEKRLSSSYDVGDRVVFGRDSRRMGVGKGEVWKVEGRNENGSLTLQNGDRQMQWDPSSHGSGSGRAEVMESRESDVFTGDKVVATRAIETEDGKISRGAVGEVVEVDQESGTLDVSFDNQIIEMDANNLTADLGYAQTAHAAQGQTYDNAIISMDSSSMTSSQQTQYVSLSRAADDAELVTDNVNKLIDNLEINTGANLTAGIEMDFVSDADNQMQQIAEMTTEHFEESTEQTDDVLNEIDEQHEQQEEEKEQQESDEESFEAHRESSDEDTEYLNDEQEEEEEQQQQEEQEEEVEVEVEEK